MRGADNRKRTHTYGPAAAQQADLWLPDAARPPVACLLHGGFWRAPYGRDQFDAVAADLVARGHAVWNIGYRRIGDPGGGWPDTLLDVAAAVDHLATLVTTGVALDLGRVTVAGHSAGGHLALWVAAAPGRSALRPTARVRPSSAVGFAAVSDLARAGQLGLGRGAVDALLQGSAADQPGRVDAGSPRALLPLGVPQLLVHGDADDVVPLGLSRDHAHAARASGDDVELVEIEGGGHMDCLDPASSAHAALCAWLARR